MKRCILLITAMLVLIIQPASADNGKTFMGVGAHFAGKNFEFDKSTGASFTAGHHWNETWALVLETLFLDDFDISNPLTDDDVDVRQVSALLRWYPIITNSAKPYISAGIGYLDIHVSDDNTLNGRLSKADICARGNMGIDWPLNDNLALEIELAGTAGIDKLSLVSFHDWNMKLLYTF
ncbi:porin family protein [Desulfoluna sp.]|uniref:porin family protein n=1 Tax=Desulfoluna sp. TaxID=2045199 RepID=UPI00260ADBC1|nr:porin family protein [Desulfoluna sp.]